MAKKAKSPVLIDTDRLAQRLSDTINKLLLRQDIRMFGKMEELEEKFEKVVEKHKSDIIDKIDPILKEVTANREERAIVSNKLSKHSDRIERIEKHVGLSTQNL